MISECRTAGFSERAPLPVALQLETLLPVGWIWETSNSLGLVFGGCLCILMLDHCSVTDQPCSLKWAPVVSSQGDPGPQVEEQGMCRRESHSSFGRRVDSSLTLGINAKNMCRLSGKGALCSPCLLVCTNKTERWFPASPESYRPRQFL